MAAQTWPRPPLRWWGIWPTHLHLSTGRHLPLTIMPKFSMYEIRIRTPSPGTQTSGRNTLSITRVGSPPPSGVGSPT